MSYDSSDYESTCWHLGISEGKFQKGNPPNLHRVDNTLLYQSCEKMFIPVYNLGKRQKYLVLKVM